jgi:hypothetical protein
MKPRSCKTSLARSGAGQTFYCHVGRIKTKHARREVETIRYNESLMTPTTAFYSISALSGNGWQFFIQLVPGKSK